MSFGRPAPVRQDLRPLVISSEPVAGVETLCDENGLVAQRYGGRDGAAYLIRPDQHVAARFAEPTADKIASALARAEHVPDRRDGSRFSDMNMLQIKPAEAV